jgi:hypothetical protein
MKTALVMASAAAALLMAGAGPARAEIVAAYMDGYGGLSSHPSGDSATSSRSGATPGLGFEIGARVLIFDAYFDRVAFGDGRGTSRGILGLRGGLGLGSLRLVLRGGVGVLLEQGGALTGADAATADRHGLVARAGVAVEKRLDPKVFAIGLALDGEYFILDSLGGAPPGTRNQGSDILGSLRVKFEIGL